MAMRAADIPITAIAKRLDRTPVAVRRFLKQYTSTVRQARQYFEAQAEKLAKRVVKHANVDQSIEVLDRIDVIPKKVQEAGMQFNVVVGMPGQAIPVPSDRIITGAANLAAPSTREWFREQQLVDPDKDRNTRPAPAKVRRSRPPRRP